MVRGTECKMTGWKCATQKALSAPCYMSISLLKDNTFTRSSFDIIWLRLSKRIDSSNLTAWWQRPMTLRAFVSASQTFNTVLFGRDYVNSKKSRNLNILCCGIVRFDRFHMAESACLSREAKTRVRFQRCGGELGPWYSKGNTGMLSRHCVNIGLQTFPTFWEHLYAGAIKTIHIRNRWLRNSAVQSGKTFVPRFTLSRDKPYVVVTKRCQNTPICECLFTFDFSKQWPHSLRIVISLGGDLAWLPSCDCGAIFSSWSLQKFANQIWSKRNICFH